MPWEWTSPRPKPQGSFKEAAGLQSARGHFFSDRWSVCHWSRMLGPFPLLTYFCPPHMLFIPGVLVFFLGHVFACVADSVLSAHLSLWAGPSLTLNVPSRPTVSFWLSPLDVPEDWATLPAWEGREYFLWTNLLPLIFAHPFSMVHTLKILIETLDSRKEQVWTKYHCGAHSAWKCAEHLVNGCSVNIYWMSEWIKQVVLLNILALMTRSSYQLRRKRLLGDVSFQDQHPFCLYLKC